MVAILILARYYHVTFRPVGTCVQLSCIRNRRKKASRTSFRQTVKSYKNASRRGISTKESLYGKKKFAVGIFTKAHVWRKARLHRVRCASGSFLNRLLLQSHQQQISSDNVGKETSLLVLIHPISDRLSFPSSRQAFSAQHPSIPRCNRPCLVFPPRLSLLDLLGHSGERRNDN